MFFTYWLKWLYSLFVTRPSPIPEPSIISVKPEVEITIPNVEEIQITKTDTDLDIDVNIDVNIAVNKVNEKLQNSFDNRKIIEKIRSYGILEEAEYKYIKELPNEQLLLFFRNLQ
jgi:hypothetical protein